MRSVVVGEESSTTVRDWPRPSGSSSVEPASVTTRTRWSSKASSPAVSSTRETRTGVSNLTCHHWTPLANGALRNAEEVSPSRADQGWAPRRTGPSELVQASEEDASTAATPSSRAAVRHGASSSSS